MPYLIIVVLACMGLWHGGDGLWVNLTSGKLTTFSAETIEQHGIANSRFINITDGTWGGGVAYQYDQDTNQVDFVIFPLVSQQVYSSIEAGNNATVKILVKKEANTSEANLDNWLDQQGMNDDFVTVQGVTLVGFNSIDAEFKDLIESMDMTVSDDVIFLEQDSKPRTIIINLLIFVPSALFFAFMIVGFFTKSDDDDESEKIDDNEAQNNAFKMIQQVMILMMLADDEIDDEEVDAIRAIYSQLTDQEYEIEQLTADITQIQASLMDVSTLLAGADESLSDSGKTLTFEAALMVAIADGELHDKEQDILDTIEVILALSTNEVAELYQKHGVAYSV